MARRVRTPKRLVLAAACGFTLSIGPAAGSMAPRPPISPVIQRVALPGSVSPLLRVARAYQSLPLDKRLTISISLKLRNQTKLTRLLSEVSNPSSPSYRRYLTPAAFDAAFGPSRSTVSSVRTWLGTKGLKVLSVSRNRTQIVASGTVRIISRAFGTQLEAYRLRGRAVFANASSVFLPRDLAPDIVAVAGLSNMDRQLPTDLVYRVSSSQAGIRGYRPTDIASIYDLNPLFTHNINGQGETVAIAAFADYSSKHVAHFNHAFNILGGAQRVKVNDGLASGAPLGDGQVETEADIELVRETAPRAKVLVYEAENSDLGTLALYNRIISDDKAQVISNSWGQYEDSWDVMDATHNALQQAAAQGQTFLAASGDNGAYDEAACCPQGDPKQLAVDYPASDPYVTGVGGTTLQGTCTAGYGKESVWSEPANTEGSGGGLSDQFTLPAYQTGPGVNNSYSSGMRQVPDVAIDASPTTGYAVYSVRDSASGWGVLGGTSPGAPLWAGLAALANEATGHSSGAWNPALYALGQKNSTISPSPFHDITVGNNLHYPATPGWDFASGWGSPNAAALIGMLAGISYPTVSSPWLSLIGTGIFDSAGRQLSSGELNGSDKALFTVQYQSANVCSGSATGKLIIQHNGQTVSTYKLRALKPGTQPGIGARISISGLHVTGTLRARFIVSLGPVTRRTEQTFKVAKG